MRLMLDPGHGGQDSGAVNSGLLGLHLITEEKVLTLDIAKRAVEYCAKEYPKVEARLTRNTDVFVSLADRAAAANSWGADLFLSIHHNARQAPERPGVEIETFHHTNAGAESRKMAGSIHRELILAIARHGNFVVDRTVKVANFYVLRETKGPAVLAELGFLSDWTEAMFLNQSEHRQLLAEALIEGVATYYEHWL